MEIKGCRKESMNTSALYMTKGRDAFHIALRCVISPAELWNFLEKKTVNCNRISV
jgi:hypothetical protein